MECLRERPPRWTESLCRKHKRQTREMEDGETERPAWSPEAITFRIGFWSDLLIVLEVAKAPVLGLQLVVEDAMMKKH